jgi:hypothetical protein
VLKATYPLNVFVDSLPDVYHLDGYRYLLKSETLVSPC